MAQRRHRPATVITGCEPRGVDQVWPPIAYEIARPEAQLQATYLAARGSLPAATAGIEIDAGVVIANSEPTRIGQFRLFVSFLNQKGGRPALWDGATHSDALALASQRACDSRPRSGHR